MAANVLVVASLTAAPAPVGRAERRAERSPIRVTLVMPAQGPGLAAASRSARPSTRRSRPCARRPQGRRLVGDANPMDAVVEYFDPARHDEVIVCTLPGRSSKWLQHDFPHRVARFTGVPVTHVVADDLRPAPTTSPAPAPSASRSGRSRCFVGRCRSPARAERGQRRLIRPRVELEHARVLVGREPRARRSASRRARRPGASRRGRCPARRRARPRCARATSPASAGSGPQSATRPATIQNASARSGVAGCGASTSRAPAWAARSIPPSRRSSDSSRRARRRSQSARS